MAFVPTSNQHESPYELTPALSQKQINTGTWGSGGNTCVITDAKIHANSAMLVWVTGLVPAAGTNWAQTIVNGSCTLTSTDGESSTLPMAYIVI